MAIDRKKFQTKVGGKDLIIETSSLALQANSAVIATYGETTVLATVVMTGKDVALDYLPLKVDYEERFYAAGKIIGSRFIRREGRPSEEAVLAGRLVDRTIRPLFDYRMRREIQVVVTVLAYDEDNEPDFVGLMAVSTALAISEVPWNGPVGGVRIAKIGNEYVVNPGNARLKDQAYAFEAFASGPRNEINMIELGGNEAQEDEVFEGFKIAQEEINKLIDFQEDIVKEIGKEKAVVALADVPEEVKAAAKEFLDGKLEDAVYQKDKQVMAQKMADLRAQFVVHVQTPYMEKGVTPPTETALGHVFEDAVDALIHKNIMERGQRPDFRSLTQVRDLDAEVSVFPRTHGSAVFVRGTTQSLAVTTLGEPGASQIVETMQTDTKRRFLLHYNFPPYSVGEVGRFGSPGRREIGHGNLAKKAIEPLIPTSQDFPYTIRVVSEILSSNGSSSMATVCASILSLMDAGVPIKKPAAGIAMGLMTDGKGGFKVLTDLQGPEDHYGDMDFKVAGTREGITAIQLDTKITGLTLDIVRQTLSQAREARMQILDFMGTVLPAPRRELSRYAPAIAQISINPSKIGLVIGPGGKTINGMIEKYGLKAIDIEDDGSVAVTADNKEAVDRAIEEITLMTRELKAGDIVEGQIVKILDFGAIMDVGGGQDGMIHVSELKNGFTKDVKEVVKLGDFVRAKVIRVDPDGRIGLSMKQLSE